MSCGLGAVALMLIFIKTNISPSLEMTIELISGTEEKISIIQNENDSIKEKISEKSNKISMIIDEIDSFQEKITVTNKLINTNVITNKALTEEINSLKNKINPIIKDYSSNYQGYLSGCNVLGDKIGIFLDNSSSMYDKSIVDILRYRVSSDTIKSTSKKWNQAVEIFKWLLEQAPGNSKIIAGTFSKEINLINEKPLSYSEIINSKDYFSTVSSFPAEGTSLRGLSKIMKKEKFDSVYIITDGLPTLPVKSEKDAKGITGKIKKYFNNECYNEKTVTPSCRKSLFYEFENNIKTLDSTFNVIMLPLEGDFIAHYHYSKLAMQKNGCFITASKDWLIK